MEKYFIAEFRLDNNNYFMLWQEETFRAVDDRPVIFKSLKELKYYTARNDLEAVDEGSLFDLDELLSLTSRTEESLCCHKILDCWNIISDLAKTTGEDFIGDHDTQENEVLYSMLVMGCNLPELFTEEAGEFHPDLGGEVKEHLENVLKDGISIVRKIVTEV